MAQKNRKKLYRVPVYWTMSGHYDVRAWNEEQAREEANNAPLPANADFVDGSFDVSDPMEIHESESAVKTEEVYKAAEQEAKEEAPIRITDSDSLKEALDKIVRKANGSI